MARTPPFTPGRLLGSGSVFAQLGDSFIDLNRRAQPTPTADVANVTKVGGGVAQAAEFLSGGRLGLPASLNFGVSGSTTGQMLARLQGTGPFDPLPKALAARAAGFFLASSGINDRAQFTAGATTYDAAYTLANLAAIRDLIVARGLPLILLGPIPNGHAGAPTMRFSTAAIRDNLRVRDELLRWPARFPGVHVLDLYDLFADPASSTPDDIRSGYVSDGRHLNQAGALQAAHPLWSAVRPYCRQAFPVGLPASNLDIRDSRHPRGSLYANPKLATANPAAGEVGAMSAFVPGTNGMGTGPLSWTGAGNNSRGGLMITYAADTRVGVISDQPRPCIRVTITSSLGLTTANTYDTLKPTAQSNSPFPAGSTWQHAAEVEWDAGSVNCSGLYTTHEMFVSGGFTRAAVNDYGGGGLPAVGAKGVLLSEPYTVPAGMTVNDVGVRAMFGTAGAACSLTYWIWGFAVRRLDG